MGCTSSSAAAPMGQNDTSDKSGPSGPISTVSWKAVHSSVRWGKIEDLRALIKSNEVVNIPDEGNGNLPIHIAAQNGHLEILELLVQKKASVNGQNAKGNTPLHMAVGYDYYECSKFLLDNGANPDITNAGGFKSINGIDGDKSLCLAALISAEKSKNVKDAIAALEMAEGSIDQLEKGSFASAGLKLKKALGSEWTENMQSQFKSIVAKL